MKSTDVILVAWAESASGPGWANQPVRVIYQTQSGELKEEWIQPKDQTDVMRTLYSISDIVSNKMRNESYKALDRSRKKG